MALARLTDPETSHEAAESVKDITATQNAILKLLSIMPMVDEDLIHYYQQQVSMGADARDFPRASESGIRSRRAELVRLGRVVDSGERNITVSRRKAIVWAVPN
jgi:hypothetical protein